MPAHHSSDISAESKTPLNQEACPHPKSVPTANVKVPALLAVQWKSYLQPMLVSGPEHKPELSSGKLTSSTVQYPVGYDASSTAYAKFSANISRVAPVG